jgi:glycosyltransferase involved in cell wall biosynthesis
VISSSHAVAKGVLTGPDQLHISYVHSPIRYAWNLQHQYLKEAGLNRGMKGWLAKWVLHKIRLWDLRTANGVDSFIANSYFIARRITKVYRRESIVIHPPVNVRAFTQVDNKESFYLTASRLVPYKRIDLIVEAFSRMPNRRLVVIGDGPSFDRVKSIAGPNIEILGYQKFEVLKDYMQRAQAFIFAAEEDFGIVPLEAQACGTPVIAYGKGALLETINDLSGTEEPTGVFFQSQTVDSIRDAVERFEKNKDKFTSTACRKNAERFSPEVFRESFTRFVNDKYEQFRKALHTQE